VSGLTSSPLKIEEVPKSDLGKKSGIGSAFFHARRVHTSVRRMFYEAHSAGAHSEEAEKAELPKKKSIEAEV
jgi:hypothetical protein